MKPGWRYAWLSPQMFEGLRRRALRDPVPGDGENPVRSQQQHRAGADDFGDHCRGPVSHQLHRHPAHDLRSVSMFWKKVQTVSRPQKMRHLSTKIRNRWSWIAWLSKESTLFYFIPIEGQNIETLSKYAWGQPSAPCWISTLCPETTLSIQIHPNTPTTHRYCSTPPRDGFTDRYTFDVWLFIVGHAVRRPDITSVNVSITHASWK